MKIILRENVKHVKSRLWFLVTKIEIIMLRTIFCQCCWPNLSALIKLELSRQNNFASHMIESVRWHSHFKVGACQPVRHLVTLTNHYHSKHEQRRSEIADQKRWRNWNENISIFMSPERVDVKYFRTWSFFKVKKLEVK